MQEWCDNCTSMSERVCECILWSPNGIQRCDTPQATFEPSLPPIASQPTEGGCYNTRESGTKKGCVCSVAHCGVVCLQGRTNDVLGDTL